MQMGVDYSEAVHRFEADMDRVEHVDWWRATGAGGPSPDADRLYVSPNSNNCFALINDLLKQPEIYAISRLLQSVEIGGGEF